MNILLLQMEMPAVWEVVLNQTFPVVLLVMAIWWFNKKNRYQEDKIDELYKLIIQDKEQDKNRLISVIEGHNQAINRIADMFEKIIK